MHVSKNRKKEENQKQEKRKTDREELNAHYRKLPAHNNQADNLVPKHVQSRSAKKSTVN